MASRKEFEMLFQLNAQLGGGYNSTFKSAQSAVQSMQKEIVALSKTQSDISAYQKQQGAVEATAKKLEILKQQYDNIQREMSETEGYSSALENKLLAKQQQIDKTSASYDEQTAKLDQMGNSLRQAGVNTDDLAKESAELGSQLVDLKKKQEAAADEANNFGAASAQAFAAVQQAIVAAGIAKALQEIYESFIACIDASVEFESAMTGVAKTTDLTDQEFAAMSESVKKMSTEIPATTTELAAIAETAGQLGIAKDFLLDFTEIMAMLGTATNMTSDEAATMLAQFSSITGMAPIFYSNLGSAIVALGNNYATTEKNIADMSQTIAAAGSIAGMSEADVVAISAAVTSLGVTAQSGGTSMMRLISDINSAVSSGKDLEDWAATAGMSADAFAAAWGDNAAGALDMFIRGLNDLYQSGGDIYGVLENLGITESRMVTMITSLAKSGTRLTETLGTANAAWAENTALTIEAEKRYATTQAQLVLMQNAYNNLKVAVGDQFTPALRELYAVGTQVFTGLAAFVQQHPALVKAVAAFASVIGTVIAALAAYAVVAKVAAAAMALLTATIPGVNIIMGVTVGLAALTAGVVALTAATSEEENEVQTLTASSRAQYYELQQLNAAYEAAKGQYEETSDEVLALRYQVDELTAAYEESKQTLKEFAAETTALLEAHSKIISSYEESTAAISNEEQGALALVLKLEELSKKTSLTTVEQQQMKAAIDALNASIPDLALNYDDATKSMNLSIEAIKKAVKAQAEQERQAESYRVWVELTKEELALSEQLATAQENLRLRREELTKKGQNVDAPLIGLFTDLGDYTKEVERLQAAYDENQAALKGVTEQAEDFAAAQSGIGGVVSDTIERMQELTAAYEEAYDAALTSIEGQYEIWDKAEKVSAVSADKVNSALKSQIDYWQDYNENLASLTERSADVEGLSDMIASFADGSAESVNVIAGMAGATDEKLAAMVANWQTLQAEQANAAGSLADLQTDFTNTMNELQAELETAVAEMDMSAEAAQSGKNTIQGLINGANSMMPAVQAAYARVAQAAINAIDAKMQIKSPSRVMWNRAEMSWYGWIKATEAMRPEVVSAMAETTNAGVQAFSNEEAQILAFAPKLMESLAANDGTEALHAQNGNGSGGAIILHLSPVYQISGTNNAKEIEAILSAHNDNLREMILEIIEEADVEAKRRAYA